VTAGKITGKNYEKFNELNFLQHNHRLPQNLLPVVAATCTGDAKFFKKIRITIASQKVLL